MPMPQQQYQPYQQPGQPAQQFSTPDQTWGEWFWGANPKIQQMQRFAPNQQSALQQMLGMGMQGAQNMQQNQFSFDPIAEHARQQFQQKTVPTLAERFSSMGGQGGQRSSAFAQQLGGAGADLEGQLAALRSQFGLQQQGQQMGWLQNLMNMGMQSPYENAMMPGTSGFMGSLGSGLGQMAGGLGTLYAGNKLGFLGK